MEEKEFIDEWTANSGAEKRRSPKRPLIKKKRKRSAAEKPDEPAESIEVTDAFDLTEQQKRKRNFKI